jgi:CheY-like chemotaxis protein
MTSAKIMIVDDNPKFLGELKESLELYGYRIICVQYGKFVLGITIEQKPDLILIDLKMEGMSGLEVADILSHSLQTYYIPIIIMSAFWTNDNMKKASDLNEVKACMKKPFKVKQLILEIEKVLK